MLILYVIARKRAYAKALRIYSPSKAQQSDIKLPPKDDAKIELIKPEVSLHDKIELF